MNFSSESVASTFSDSTTSSDAATSYDSEYYWRKSCTDEDFYLDKKFYRERTSATDVAALSKQIRNEFSCPNNSTTSDAIEAALRREMYPEHIVEQIPIEEHTLTEVETTVTVGYDVPVDEPLDEF